MSPPMPGSEQLPAAWSLYLMSHDLPGTAHRIEEHGGKMLVPPMEIPDNGRMLFAMDPSGAAFGAWEPGRHTGSQLFDEDGAMCWAEVNTREPAVTDYFYHGLFGYRQRRIGTDDGFDYSAWSLGDADPVAGRLTMTSAWDGVPAHWTVYFATADTDAAVEFVKHTLGDLEAAGTELQDTVRTFVASQCNASRAAARLYTHRNTLLRRLARAEELLPRPLADSSVEVAVALDVLRWRG